MGISYTTEGDGYSSYGSRVIVTATFDNNYTAGGEPLAAADAGLDRIARVTVEGAIDGGVLFDYDPEVGTIKAYQVNTTSGAIEELAGASAAADGATVRLVVDGGGS